MTIFKSHKEAQTICPNFHDVYAPLGDAQVEQEINGHKPKEGFVFLWFNGSMAVDHPQARGYDHYATYWMEHGLKVYTLNEEIVLEVRQKALCAIIEEHASFQRAELELLPRVISQPLGELCDYKNSEPINKAARELEVFYISRNALKALKRQSANLWYNEEEAKRLHKYNSYPSGWMQGVNQTKGEFTCIEELPL